MLLLVWWLARSGVFVAGGLGGVLYVVNVDASFNAYSAINSSPWTYENMSGDKTKANSGSKYVWLANATALGIGGVSSVIAMSFWPLAGALTVVVIMHSLYGLAIRSGRKEGNTGWAGESSSSSSDFHAVATA